jgi:hypothetical protein
MCAPSWHVRIARRLWHAPKLTIVCIFHNSCLENQPYDYWLSDTNRRTANKPPFYFPAAFGKFTPLNPYFIPSDSNIYVAYDLQQEQNVLVAMAMSADNITMISNISPGRIVGVRMTKSFMALSGDGLLEALVQNTGVLTSHYSARIYYVNEWTRNVTLIQCSFLQLTIICSRHIIPIAAMSADIHPFDTWNPTARIDTTYQLQAQNWCTG